MHKRNMQFILLTSIHIQSQQHLCIIHSGLACLLNLYVSYIQVQLQIRPVNNIQPNSKHQTLDPAGISNLSKSHTDSTSNYTSIEVDIFFSLILSYFCFLVPAFSPCQGRLEKK